MKLKNGTSIGNWRRKIISGILKATGNGLRQQSFASRAVIKADQSELYFQYFTRCGVMYNTETK